MRRMKDPFSPTPEGFHRRVEATLRTLEEKDMKKHYNKTVLLVATLMALMAVTAVATVVGQSGLKQKLSNAGAGEVAELAQEVHRSADSADAAGFDFSIDEIIWEAGDLYISYSMTVPEDGGYLVAMSTPTLNGKKLAYDAKGWTTPKFIDAEDASQAVLLLGGGHRTSCNELWTFAVDPRLKDRDDNRLGFKAVLYRTEEALEGHTDWTDLLDPPACLSDGAQGAVERADYVAEREISMNLNAAALPEVVFNDVAEHDFDVEDRHIHVNAFRMTHLGASIEYTVSAADAAGLDGLPDEDWRFGTPDGKALGFSMGGSGGASMEKRDDGTAVYHCSWREHAFLPLKDTETILFAPVSDDDDGQMQYDATRAVTLTPVYNPDITPEPAPVSTLEPGEDISR